MNAATRNLDGFFTPRSVALVGASESSGWTRMVLDGVELSTGLRDVHLVNPRRHTVHGRATVPALSALDEAPDLAFVMVGPDRVAPVVEEALTLGTRDLVVLSAGLGETGRQGATVQRDVAALCARHGGRLLGPNVSGYVNVPGGVRLFGLPVPGDLPGGRVGVVLQSGGLATHVLALARAWGVGLSLLATTGNESMVTATDVIGHLVDDPDTDVVAVFLESVRDTGAFRDVALRAAHAGKPLVALHVGRSPLGRAAALSHTGALVGDHGAALAALADLGVVTVETLEDLVATAALLSRHRSGLRGRRVAVVAASGGACELIADAAESLGLTLPPFSAALTDGMAAALPEFAEVRNPLDVTGFVVKAADLPFLATQRIGQDARDDYDVLILQSVVLPAVPGPDADAVRARFARLAGAVRDSPIPVVLQTGGTFALSPFGLELVRDNELTVLPGIAAGMRALDGAARYAEALPRALRRHDRAAPPVSYAGRATGLPALAPLLVECGVPVPPGRLARSADEVLAAAGEIGYPVVLKVVADDIAHKSDIGGVALDLRDADQAVAAYERMLREVAAAVPDARVDGVLVTAMRPAGTELLVGVVVDPAWGPMLTVGAGGVLAELLGEVAVRPLPVSEQDVVELLAGLRVGRLLDGYRGVDRADIAAVAGAIVGVTRVAEVLGPDLLALEVNPLWVAGDQVEALDLLVVRTAG